MCVKITYTKIFDKTKNIGCWNLITFNLVVTDKHEIEKMIFISCFFCSQNKHKKLRNICTNYDCRIFTIPKTRLYKKSDFRVSTEWKFRVLKFVIRFLWTKKSFFYFFQKSNYFYISVSNFKLLGFNNIFFSASK